MHNILLFKVEITEDVFEVDELARANALGDELVFHISALPK
ncbi:MAG: hypothetical protein ACSHX8_14480 [Opitutaceae bacterium]